jgi:hypothetical protein
MEEDLIGNRRPRRTVASTLGKKRRCVRLKVKQLEILPYDFDLYGLLKDSGPPLTDLSISSKFVRSGMGFDGLVCSHMA